MDTHQILQYLKDSSLIQNKDGKTFLIQMMGSDLDGQLRGKSMCIDKVSKESFENGFGK